MAITQTTVKNGYRPLIRDRNGLTIFLHMKDWPEDVPMPDGTTEMVTGDGPSNPYWRIYLEPDKTVEMVVGWFIVPHLSIEGTIDWYQVEMESRGWVEEERADTLPDWAKLRYHHPETDVHVEISIRRNRFLNRTQPLIRRVTIHPWPPADEEASGTEAAIPADGSSEDQRVEAPESLALQPGP